MKSSITVLTSRLEYSLLAYFKLPSSPRPIKARSLSLLAVIFIEHQIFIQCPPEISARQSTTLWGLIYNLLYIDLYIFISHLGKHSFRTEYDQTSFICSSSAVRLHPQYMPECPYCHQYVSLLHAPCLPPWPSIHPSYARHCVNPTTHLHPSPYSLDTRKRDFMHILSPVWLSILSPIGLGKHWRLQPYSPVGLCVLAGWPYWTRLWWCSPVSSVRS